MHGGGLHTIRHPGRQVADRRMNAGACVRCISSCTWLGQEGLSYPVEVPAWCSLTRIPAGDRQAVGQDLHAHATGREEAHCY